MVKHARVLFFPVEPLGASKEHYGRFHKPNYALRQALMLFAKLLRLKKLLKSLAQSVRTRGRA